MAAQFRLRIGRIAKYDGIEERSHGAHDMDVMPVLKRVQFHGTAGLADDCDRYSQLVGGDLQ